MLRKRGRAGKIHYGWAEREDLDSVEVPPAKKNPDPQLLEAYFRMVINEIYRTLEKGSHLKFSPNSFANSTTSFTVKKKH